jgi:hypothetical protein
VTTPGWAACPAAPAADCAGPDVCDSEQANGGKRVRGREGERKRARKADKERLSERAKRDRHTETIWYEFGMPKVGRP